MLAGNAFGTLVRAAAPSEAPLGAEWRAAGIAVVATTRAREEARRPITLAGHAGVQARCMGTYTPHPYYRSPRSGAMVFSRVDADGAQLHLHRSAEGGWWVSGTADMAAGRSAGWLHSSACGAPPLRGGARFDSWRVLTADGWRPDPNLVAHSALFFKC